MKQKMEPILPPLKPIPMKDRVSVLFLERGQLDVLNGAFVLVDKTGVRTHIPVGGVVCMMLEPGIRVSHAAVTLASRVGCLLVWVGEAGVRLYASGQPGGARADRLLYQAKLALDDAARLKVVRKMYELRFKEKPPERRSVVQLRGIEGARVRKMYELLARQYQGQLAGEQLRPLRMGERDIRGAGLSPGDLQHVPRAGGDEPRSGRKVMCRKFRKSGGLKSQKADLSR